MIIKKYGRIILITVSLLHTLFFVTTLYLSFGLDSNSKLASLPIAFNAKTIVQFIIS